MPHPFRTVLSRRQSLDTAAALGRTVTVALSPGAHTLGGFRGIGITPKVETFERCLAAEHQRAFRVYADRDGVTA